MLDFARWTWTASLAALILSLAITRRLRSLPVFSLYLLATATQAAMHWRNIDMLSSWWPQWTIPLACLKACSVAEAFWHRGSGMRRRPMWLLGLAGFAGGATFLWGRVRPDSPWLEAAMVFRHFESGLLAFAILCIAVAAIWGHTTERWLKLHSWLLVALIANTLAGLLWYEHLPSGFTDTDWARVQVWTYLGAAACYAGWVASLRGFPHARAQNSSRN